MQMHYKFPGKAGRSREAPMSQPRSDRAFAEALEAVYDTALSPAAWPRALDRLAALFDCHFADVFTRSHDRSRYAGLAHGLDRADYQDLFLDTWFTRNVWGLARPVREPGEVISTRQMVDPSVLLRSEIYADYLAPRGLHEGLRLAIAADADGVQDVSLLRAWKAGPFGADDLDLGRALLPHLQRAAAIARRLGFADAASRAGLLALEAAGLAVILLGAGNRVLLCNGAAERLLRSADGLASRGGELWGSTGPATRLLRVALARGFARVAGTVRLPRPSGASPLVAVAMPLHGTDGWEEGVPPRVALLVGDPLARGPSPGQLARLFGLTDAEAELAGELLAGRDLREVAARRRRSINTVRNHLARLMSKTDTTRQAELVGLLRAIPAEPAAAPDAVGPLYRGLPRTPGAPLGQTGGTR